MYSIPLAMSCANPVNLRGDNGANFLGPIALLCELFIAVLAARSKDSNRPRIANSIIKRCGSEIDKQIQYTLCTVHNSIQLAPQFLPFSTQAPKRVTTFE